MSDISPGWYKDPADPTTQRWWDGEGWIGEALPADATPPDGPPPTPPPPPPAPPPAATTTPAPGGYQVINGSPPARDGGPQGWPYSPPTAPPPQTWQGPPPPGWQGPPFGQQAPVPGWQPGMMPPPGWSVPIRPHGLPLATYGARFVARLIDLGVLIVLALIANSWFLIQWVQELQAYIPQFNDYLSAVERGDSPTLPVASDRSSYLQLAMLITTTLLWFAYEVPQVANSGQTLGKRLARIKAIRLDTGQAPGFGRSFRRWNLFGTATLFWSCCGIGFFWQLLDGLSPLFDRQLQRAWHDRVAQTVVVQLPKDGAPGHPVPPAGPTGPAGPPAAPADPGGRTEENGERR